MEEKPHPLSDLSFFKFPEVSPEVVQGILLFFVVLLLIIVFARQIHDWLGRRGIVKERRRSLEKLSQESKQPKYLREMLAKLAKLAGVKDGLILVQDAQAFETAVQKLYEQAEEGAPREDMDTVARLRRVYHLNVMNPLLRLVSTRQLLPDLPLRLISKAGGETLDVYCTLLDVNEAFMLVDVPQDQEVRNLLRAHPQVQLVFWREQDGETVFPTALEFVASDTMPLVRAKHVMSNEDVSQRADFRLTVDFPLTWRYVEREKIGKIKAVTGEQLDVRHGEGKMLDFSYGGAAFECHEPLAPGGLAQLQFSIRSTPVHMMLEVMAQTGTAEGVWVHRGRIRGMTQETRNRIFNYLSREQVVRLREHEVIRRKLGESEPA